MRALLSVMAAALAATALQAAAQDYPSRPVRVVFTFPPGSSTDIVGRLYTQKLGEYWGQNVLADNRGGAGGTIGAGIVAKAAADGYTLLIHSSGIAVGPSIYAKLPYDTAKDFAGVAPLAEQPNVLVVNPGSPYKTLGDLMARAKAKPGSINFASAGVGSGTHLNLEKFKLATKLDVTHIPYKGSGEVLIDVIGGRVDCYFAPISAALANIQAGKLRGLAVSTAKRSGVLPDVPTIAEAGVPKFEFSLWFGLWAPAGTPAAIVNKIAKDVQRAAADPEVRSKLVSLGNDTMNMSPKEFNQFVLAEMRDYAAMLKAAGVTPQ